MDKQSVPRIKASSKSSSARLRRHTAKRRESGRRRVNAAERRRAMSLVPEPIFYMDSPSLHGPNAYEELFEESEAVALPDTGWYQPVVHQASPDKTVKQAKSQVLTAAQERILFLQYNYARFRLETIRSEVKDERPRDSQVRGIFEWHDRVHQLRSQIAESNLALVLAMAKRLKSSSLEFGDLVSEGNMALLRSIEKFDIDRGFKFSTYACRAILKAFSRMGLKHTKYRERFPTEFDPMLESSNEPAQRRREDEMERAQEAVHVVVNNTAQLSDIEQEVIHHRFGIDAGAHGKRLTLAQVGDLIGLTKERVRQIQNRALEKLRDTLAERYLPPRDSDSGKSMMTVN